MALMPEDLQNQRFTPVRFSEGYDMDEVDNFLDNDVEPRLKELIAENERLKKELEEAHNRIAELESGAAEATPAADTAATGETDAIIDTAPVTSEQDEAAEETPAAADTTAQQPVVEAPGAQESPDQSAAGIIALANRLHDEYVKKGEDERDRLITEANDEHKRIVGDAEEKSRVTLAELEEKKAELDKTIEGLRNFERDYRNRLRNYLENQLRDLDTSETQDKQANFGL
ncbi:DivIVA domain-containing protein [Brachybacterium saurashtrense]|uniref:Cell wall synthesis protein Wag31 n=1 Tax=Brachybacterium saurashtrense TaxID=556288 RepID=A0A345YL41_9MICO|nr:DivIVA domain-containing protein [Brachybacterium saurashtrense]AXK44643.1 DivIVA domain-containing protein [Brachybacterium saurashtrense]RRR23255.1 DivIVA domain-containing protein [Brachybacterium saurashtrense]